MKPFFCNTYNHSFLGSTHKNLTSIGQRIFLIPALFSGLILFYSCQASTKQKPDVLVTTTNNLLIPQPVPISHGETERLRQGAAHWHDSVLRPGSFNGGMIVAKNGNIVFEEYNGTGHLRSKDTVTESTSFHIASVSKTFTATAVLKLWQDGKYNIDDEFSKFFPQFNYPGVTIRTLLNHRSGLPNYVHFLEEMGWNKQIYVTNQDVLDFLVSRKAELTNIGRPNGGFSYCNTNYALLALLVEKVSGKPFGEYMQQTFFTPLNMKHTFVYNHLLDSGKVNPSYDHRGRQEAFTFLDVVYGDKNVYSTPRDLLTWDRALSTGILLTQPTLDQAYAPYSNEKAGIRNYGLGWRMNVFPNGKKMIYHNGWWHGNNTSFIRLIQDSATIIVVGNRFNTNIYHAKDLVKLFGNYFVGGEDDEAENLKPGKLIVSRPLRKTMAASKRKKGKQITRKITRKRRH